MIKYSLLEKKYRCSIKQKTCNKDFIRLKLFLNEFFMYILFVRKLFKRK